MKQKTILFLLVLLSTLTASAYDAEIDGIYYYLNPDTKQAEVRAGSSMYTGSIAIPEKVIYYDVTYSVTSIGKEAFRACSDLTDITIPNSITSIGESAFIHCSNLTKITIPNSITILKRQLFNDCTSLESVVIPNSVTEIESLAFYKCKSLRKLYCYAMSIPTTNIKAFNDTNVSSATLYVPAALLETYKTTEPWRKFGTIVAISEAIPGDVNEDGEVNGTDIQAIINFIVSGQYDAKADVNTDGTVNGTDIQEIINIIVNGE